MMLYTCIKFYKKYFHGFKVKDISQLIITKGHNSGIIGEN